MQYEFKEMLLHGPWMAGRIGEKAMKGLRAGVTTGLCAAAAAKAAAMALLFPGPVGQVEIRAKNGAAFVLEVTDTELGPASARCAVRKDAGDDPDVTDGVKVFAALTKTAGGGIAIDGGEGIGRVTKPGLQVPVGHAAINPAPMEMIRAAIAEVCAGQGYVGGIRAVISIPGGAEVAKRTMNGRLGIVGGLSVLGTTGIVEPMSTRAILETIKAVIDVQAASGKKRLLIVPGNYGLDYAEKALGLDVAEAVRCSNFIGETLDHASTKGFDRITLVGHAGKLVKLAGGVMNTHSAVADCRMEIVAAHCAMAGAGADAARRIMECPTVEAAIGIMDALGVSAAVWDSIGEKIGFHLRERVRDRAIVEFIVFTQEHGILTAGATRRGNGALTGGATG